MLNTLNPVKSSKKCYDCGSDLLLIEEKVEIVEGQLSPVTTSYYKCSDQSCSDDFDKKTIIRAKQRQEQEDAKVKRMENMRLSRIKNKILK